MNFWRVGACFIDNLWYGVVILMLLDEVIFFKVKYIKENLVNLVIYGIGKESWKVDIF